MNLCVVMSVNKPLHGVCADVVSNIDHFWFVDNLTCICLECHGQCAKQLYVQRWADTAGRRRSLQMSGKGTPSM